MKTFTLLSAALLSSFSLPAAVLAQTALTNTTTAGKASAAGSAAAAMDTLAGKPQIVGITEKNGTMFLGRVLSGGHSRYTVQTFHFAGPPQSKTQTYGTGRNRHRVRVQTQTFIPDTGAVTLLLAGVAGSRVDPRELATGTRTVSASNIKYLQALSPPVKPAKTQKTSGTQTASSPVPLASPWAWTITTLWPSISNEAKSK